ncbi:MAG: bifunctional nuclease domain-containing protein [Ignavibacterium sp.]|uniref:bifunctional nuclease domain-containing protein n=1 Tax=Ignavibacterium sp. TaxID=2651167 RepID=UPI004049B093
MNKVQCEIIGLSSSPVTGGAYAILLKEIDGNRRLPIIIGQFEAQAIALEMEGIRPPRPLTHDLLKSVIDNLGGTVIEIIVNELRENTFYAKIILEVGGLTNEIDARPSDAIALAVRSDAPIYVTESVMEAASFIPTDELEHETSSAFDEELPSTDKLPKSKEAQIAALQEKLREAIEKEDYERAAKIRDDIKKLTQSN